MRKHDLVLVMNGQNTTTMSMPSPPEHGNKQHGKPSGRIRSDRRITGTSFRQAVGPPPRKTDMVQPFFLVAGVYM